MDNIFSRYDFIIVYIDDILVHSENIDEHILHLYIFIKELEAHGIVLYDKKIDLFKETIEFLGIIVINGQIRCSPT